MMAGPRTVARSSRAPASTTTRPSTCASLTPPSPPARPGDRLALAAAVEGVEDGPVGLQHVVEPAGVLPPAAHDVRLDPMALVDQPLDPVGDLELAARRGLDRARRLVDARGEHVDAAQREVARRVGRLLNQAQDGAGVVEL